MPTRPARRSRASPRACGDRRCDGGGPAASSRIRRLPARRTCPMVTDPFRQDQATARAALRRAAAEAAGRGARLRLDQQTAALVLRATGAADLDPETLIGLLVSNLEQAALAPVLTATWRERGEAALRPQVQAP